MQVMVSVAAERLDQIRLWAALCERHGIDALGIGDSPRYRETWVSAAVAAAATERIRIGSMVTNFVTRSPEVTAAALRAIDDLSSGRAFAGVGSGDSAVAGVGRPPARAEAVRVGIATLRREWADAAPDSQPWRVLMAANGPRGLAVGGELADVVVSGAGITPEVIERSRTTIRAAAAAARPPASDVAAAGPLGRGVATWAVVRMAIDRDADAALGQLLPLLASGANHVFRVPGELELLDPATAQAVAELRANYDYASHGRADDNLNAALVDRLGLRTALGGRFALAGSPEAIARRLRALAGLGVDGIVIPAIGLDPVALIRRLGEEVLPLVHAT